MKRTWSHGFLSFTLGLCLAAPFTTARAQSNDAPHGLWDVYARYLKPAKYVDLTHTITPSIPVWAGFLPPKFFRTINPKTGKPYEYKTDNFEASGYTLPTDQLGTQLDPPAHWNPDYPAIDELPPTFAVRPLVVISIVDKVKTDPGYQMQVADIEDWEKRTARSPRAASCSSVRTGRNAGLTRNWPRRKNSPA